MRRFTFEHLTRPASSAAAPAYGIVQDGKATAAFMHLMERSMQGVESPWSRLQIARNPGRRLRRAIGLRSTTVVT